MKKVLLTGCLKLLIEYSNDPKFSDRQVWANCVDLEEQSDQGLHYLLFHLHLLETFLCRKTNLIEI